MRTIYITSHNGKLSKKGETLVFIDTDGMNTTLFPAKVEQIYIIGMAEITSKALRLLMKYQIEVVFISRNGRYDGKLVFGDTKNVFLRKNQYTMLLDQTRIVSHVKDIVTGKLVNQYSFMKRIGRKKGAQPRISDVCKNMERHIRKVPFLDTVDSLRGAEGYGARLYFSVFSENIIQDWAEFNGRSKNPPRDNVNSVLSFLYTLLSYRVDSAIQGEGLDSGVGLLHSMSYGRKSLVFDLMEEFRTPVVDTLACALFNLGILHPNDFEIVSGTVPMDEITESSEEGLVPSLIDGETGVYIKNASLRKIVAHFEKKLDDLHQYPPRNKQLTYREIIHEQVRCYKQFLLGERNHYTPMVVK